MGGDVKKMETDDAEQSDDGALKVRQKMKTNAYAKQKPPPQPRKGNTFPHRFGAPRVRYRGEAAEQVTHTNTDVDYDRTYGIGSKLMNLMGYNKGMRFCMYVYVRACMCTPICRLFSYINNYR